MGNEAAEHQIKLMAITNLLGVKLHEAEKLYQLHNGEVNKICERYKKYITRKSKVALSQGRSLGD